MRKEIEQAITLLEKKDPKALEHALELLQGTVFSFSMRVCGQREDAEDTMQEVLVKALPYLPKFESPRALLVWLYKVAKNRCLMSRRKSKYAPSRIFLSMSSCRIVLSSRASPMNARSTPSQWQSGASKPDGYAKPFSNCPGSTASFWSCATWKDSRTTRWEISPDCAPARSAFACTVPACLSGKLSRGTVTSGVYQGTMPRPKLREPQRTQNGGQHLAKLSSLSSRIISMSNLTTRCAKNWKSTSTDAPLARLFREPRIHHRAVTQSTGRPAHTCSRSQDPPRTPRKISLCELKPLLFVGTFPLVI